MGFWADLFSSAFWFDEHSNQAGYEWNSVAKDWVPIQPQKPISSKKSVATTSDKTAYGSFVEVKPTAKAEPKYVDAEREITVKPPITKRKVNIINIAGAAYIPMATTDISSHVTIADGKYTNDSVLSLWGTFELRPAEGTEIVTVKVNGEFATDWSMYRYIASKVLVKSGAKNTRYSVNRTALARARYWIEVHLGVGEHVDSIEIETQY